MGELASLASQDWMNTRLCLTLTCHLDQKYIPKFSVVCFECGMILAFTDREGATPVPGDLSRETVIAICFQAQRTIYDNLN